ncbi:MAG: sn-glycerol-3-phosphate transporter ATP-binding protein [Fibrobacteres bacterium]|nr:sn-glycerol-3-phosphate transporter ATP-binding protein [Fibrobacterota bacterium]
MTAKDARIRLEGVAKKFGNVIAVFPTDVEVAQGEFVVILGPSGCGKTTTLRMIAGLEAPSQGSVFINGKDVTRLRPGDRDIAFVFQMFSLYPHLTVQENVAFTMLAQGLSSQEAMRRSGDMLRHLGLGGLVHVRPGNLSGGDQQRVALARALVRSPQAFLMDEPLGTLDGSMREEMRETLRAIHNRSGATTVFVTHDQEEAMGLADRIAVMKDGRVVQFDHPRTIYDNPVNLFVADFVGSPGMNILAGVRRGEWVDVPALGMRLRVAEDGDSEGITSNTASGGECRLGVRPENVLLSEDGSPCVVEHTEALGSHNMLSLRTAAGFLKAWIPAGIRFREGETIGATFLPSGCRWFDGASGEALPWKTLEAVCRPTR